MSLSKLLLLTRVDTAGHAREDPAPKQPPGEGRTDLLPADVDQIAFRRSRACSQFCELFNGVMLEPAGNPAVVTARAASALAEAVRAVSTLSARTLRYCRGVRGALNTIATRVHVRVRPAMRGGMRPRLRACPMQSNESGCGGECDRRRNRQNDGKDWLRHEMVQNLSGRSLLLDRPRRKSARPLRMDS
jgi:hypothetical protein